jgi:hypothetical protein
MMIAGIAISTFANMMAQKPSRELFTKLSITTKAPFITIVIME